MDPATLTPTRASTLEEAARIADFYATENFRLAADTVACDPIIQGTARTAQDVLRAVQLRHDGHRHASMAHVAQCIAAAIREAALEKGRGPMDEAKVNEKCLGKGQKRMMAAAETLFAIPSVSEKIHEFDDAARIPTTARLSCEGDSSDY